MVQTCELSNVKIDQDLGILLTSHPRGQFFMQAGLMSWKHSGKWILLGYDDDTDNALQDEVRPYVDEIFVTGQRSAHVGGELRQFKMGGKILQEHGFSHFFKSAADTTTFRHCAFKELYDVLGDNDFARNGTSIVFGKVSSLVKMMEPYHPHFKCGSAELYWANVGKQLGLTSVGLDRKEWNYKLGRVHIQGEYAKYHFNGKVPKTWEIGEIWKK